MGVAVALVAIGAGGAYLYLNRKPKDCLDPENFREFKLVDKKQLSHNVAKFRASRRFKYQPGQVKEFGMIAGGSGITPMFQEELDGLVNKYAGRFQVYYVLNQPPENWNGGVGFVSKDMIQKHCPTPVPGIQILRCGPPPTNKAMAAHLDDLGYTKDMQFQF